MDAELDELLAAVPAVAIDGPKGVGKTATLQRRATTVFQLDTPAHRTLAEADPARLLEAPTPILLDEWQRVPAVWDAVRRAVDADSRLPNRYLLAGSAAPNEAPVHSGAGRIVTVRMRPLSMAERMLAAPTVSLQALLRGSGERLAGRTSVHVHDYVREIEHSGLPGLHHLTGRALRAQLDGYLRQIVDHDIPQEGYELKRPATLRRWLEAYAAATATITSQEKLRVAASAGDGVEPDRRTTTSYRTILERLWIVDPLPGWLPSRNHLGRVGQAPKHHLVDPALAVRLLGLDSGSLLEGAEGATALQLPRDGVLLGRLFESLVTQSVRVYAQQAEARVSHFRTHQGREEVDLIVQRGDGSVLAMEVKFGATVTDADVRHLLWLRRKLGAELIDAVVVTTGDTAYRRRDGIAVVPAALLGP